MPLEQPQSIRTVFFDAGFTLLRPYPSVPQICQQACRQLGLHIELEQVEQAMLAAEDYFLRYTRLHRHTWADEQAIEELWTNYYINMLRPCVAEHDERRLYQLAKTINREFDKHSSWELYPDVRATVETLHQRGYTLGVISDWGIVLGPIFRQLELTRYFECLLISSAARHAKPAPVLYETALTRCNAIADYSVHIGDSYINDVLGARSVGITPVLLDRAHRLQPSDVDCLLIHSLDELLDLLEVTHE
ncbi:MAG TPA: HAD family hydrolase [Ktedonobacteraceae bacterium]|jgi:FMN phosphatase YigB (HAD superfamily)|nr:HAD family hydrolase [Ktedonobacteraceae bacterium]